MSERLIALRNRSGLTPTDVADRLTITPENYRRFETGERKPTPELLARILSILSVDLADPLGGAT